MESKNLISSPPLQVAIADKNGNMSRPWAIFFRDIYNRIAYKGGNAIDANKEATDALTGLTDENIEQIGENERELSEHVSSEEAHDSNGGIVGFNDVANSSKFGLVRRMTSVSFAVESTVNIIADDLPAAPVSYSQSYMQSVADLTNENKEAVNQLSLDLNEAILTLNDLITQCKNSGQMDL